MKSTEERFNELEARVMALEIIVTSHISSLDGLIEGAAEDTIGLAIAHLGDAALGKHRRVALAAHFLIRTIRATISDAPLTDESS